jgi:hypothetical protein
MFTIRGKTIILIPTKIPITDFLFVRLIYIISYNIANIPLNNLSWSGVIRLTSLPPRVLLLLSKGSGNLCLYLLF